MCWLHCSWLGGRRSPNEPWAGSADATGPIVAVGCRSKICRSILMIFCPCMHYRRMTTQAFHCAKLDLILAHVLLARCFGIDFFRVGPWLVVVLA